MSETAGNTERSIDPVRRIETAMEQASVWGLEFIKSIDDLKAENARLRERLAQAEGLLREVLSDYDSAPSYLERYRHVDIYDTQADEIRTFLHPEPEREKL